MAVTSVGTPAVATSTSSPLTGTWGTGQTRTAGNILVALVGAAAATSVASLACSTGGWTQVGTGASEGHAACAAFWIVAAGGDAAPAFTATLASTQGMNCVLWELAGAGSPQDTSGTASGTTANPLAITTAGNVSAAGEYGLAVHEALIPVAGADAWTPDGAWTNAATDGLSGRIHGAYDFIAGPTSGATLTVNGTWATVPAHEAGMVVVFPAAAAGGATPAPLVVPSAAVMQAANW